MKTPVIKERGQGTIEYALLIAIIAFVVIAFLALVHDRTIQASITGLFALPDPLAASSPPPETPDQIVNRTIDIIDAVAPVAVAILIIYSLTHSRRPADHRGRAKPARRK